MPVCRPDLCLQLFQLNKFDKEVELYKDKVYEYDINFPPRWVDLVALDLINYGRVHTCDTKGQGLSLTRSSRLPL